MSDKTPPLHLMHPSPDSSNIMFHSFQGIAPPRSASELSQETPKLPTSGVTKRTTTPHACAECKRRKIRCDGRQPCGQCIGCRSPKLCYYDKHRQRVIPSRKALDALQQSLDECRAVLKRLYPARDPQSLLNLSRQELILLLDRGSVGVSQSSPTVSHSSDTSDENRFPLAPTSDDDRSLANLEQIPNQDTEWDEERRYRAPIPVESDDVNSLSLSVDRQSSYLGASSIKAAFLVMFKVAPGLRSLLGTATNNNRQLLQSNQPTPHPGVDARPQSRIQWSSEGQTIIDAYFNRVQIFIPMLDEPSFRADYLAGQRNDSPWLALLNMVFAMGSIAAMKSDDHDHVNFYNRSKEHLGIDNFGSSHLETLQAYALMGGYYLHYINRPNMANAIMGGALRMAYALGLHREGVIEPNSSDGEMLHLELRRRTWWCLFCLDTWASTTLGRPSLGRWGPAITIRPPEGTKSANEKSTTGQNIRIVPLIENIKFCKIATLIQDAFALSPLPRAEDREMLDAQLSEWAENLPWILCSTDSCPEALYTARCVMKWRYQNLRIVLHRPVLLNLANRGSQAPPTPAEIGAVEKCRAIAKQTIQDITREWAQNQVSGWNGVWFLYQASMIPLVSIFWENWNSALVREWQSQVEMVLDGLGAMAEWSLSARRSREVVSKIYEASKKPATRAGGPRLTTTGRYTSSYSNGNTNGNINKNTKMVVQDGPLHDIRKAQMPHDGQMGMLMDDGLDNQSIWDQDWMLWGSLSEGLGMPFDGIPEMKFEDPTQGNYGGVYMMHQ